MAKKKKSDVNVSERIRTELQSDPGAKPAQIAEKLKAEGLDVKANYISAIKSAAKAKGKTRRKPGRPAKSGRGPGRPPGSGAKKESGSVSVSAADLIEAQRLAKQLGGVKRAQQLFNVLSQLQA